MKAASIRAPKLFVLLWSASVTTGSLLMLCPVSARAQGGVPLWTNRYDGPANGNDFANAIAVDRSGNVFVTGGTSINTATGSSLDYATVKYSNAGVPLWTNLYNGPGDDEPRAIAVDASGNVFVTGSSAGIGTQFDYATVAYSSAGVPLWTNRYNGPANFNDEAAAIAVDAGGNLFVTGSSDNGGSLLFDYATIAYSSAGVPLWTNRYNGPGNGEDYASAIALDSSGNVFVTGSSLGSEGFNDSATLAYSNSGMPLWTNRSSGGLGLAKMAVDRNGNVFVTRGARDYVTIKYSSSVPPPRLDFQLLNNQLVLSWTNASFNLQSAPAVTDTFTNLPGATSPFTNLLTAPQQFFRLKGD